MKPISTLLVIGMAAGICAIAFAAARPVHAQNRERDRIHQLILEGAGSHIGVTARDLEPAEADRLKLTGGVWLESVSADSPASRAGLRADDVIVEFDGERVRSVRQFTRLVRETPPDRAVRTIALRDGRRGEYTVTPAASGLDTLTLDSGRLRDRIEDFTARIRPFDFDLGVRDWSTRSRLGITAQELTPDLAAYFGAADGVLVASVVADSPAGRAGIKAGDVITTINGRSVRSAGDLVRELRTASADANVALGIVRDKKESTVQVQVEVSTRRARPERPSRPVRPIRTPV